MSVTITVVNQLESMTSFGLTKESSESVFISAKIARELDLFIGDEFEAVLIPNQRDMNGRTPWAVTSAEKDGVSACMATTSNRVRVTQPAKSAEPVQLQMDLQQSEPEPVPMDTKTISLDGRILALLESEGDFLSTAQIAKDLGVATHAAHGACDRLHLKGKIAKAPVWAAGTQTKASWVLWATTTDYFRNLDDSGSE